MNKEAAEGGGIEGVGWKDQTGTRSAKGGFKRNLKSADVIVDGSQRKISIVQVKRQNLSDDGMNRVNGDI